jgi:hypothetical protein
MLLVTLSEIRLAYTWNTENGIIFVNDERIPKLEKCLTYALCQVEKGRIFVSSYIFGQYCTSAYLYARSVW